jgi:RNA polymerase sigma factor (sigma-70 family)
MNRARNMEDITFDEIRQIQEGNRGLFDRVMLLYKKRVADLCFKYMRSNEEAADMAQEVFVLLYNNIGSFGFKSGFGTWVYRITVNTCINRLKYHKRRISTGQAMLNADGEADDPSEKLPDMSKPADEALELAELRDAILKELDNFPERERTIVILRDMEGLSCEEISAILKVPVGSVKSLAARTRGKVRLNMIRKMGEKLGL